MKSQNFDKIINRILLVGIFVLFFVFIFSSNQLFAKNTENNSKEKIFYWFENINGLDDFKRNYRQIDILAPQIYEVDFDLEVVGPTNKEIIREGKRLGVKIMPLIVNKYFDKVLMSDILLSPKAQDEIINFMLREAKRRDYIGWQFDFENINHLDREMYTEFVARAGEKMRENNLTFSVAVSVRDSKYNRDDKEQDWSSAYDYKNLAPHVDFISLMTYDDPKSVGPVSSMPYLQKTLDYILTEVESDKLSLGIPFYCWQWQNGRRIRSLTYKNAEDQYFDMESLKIIRFFDENLQAEAFVYNRGGVMHTVWCDNDKSFENKNGLVEGLNLRGFSVWALGQGDRNIWRFLKSL